MYVSQNTVVDGDYEPLAIFVRAIDAKEYKQMNDILYRISKTYEGELWEKEWSKRDKDIIDDFVKLDWFNPHNTNTPNDTINRASWLEKNQKCPRCGRRP